LQIHRRDAARRKLPSNVSFRRLRFEPTMRASRLLTIQMLLQTRGRLSAAALARTLEVSVRTLYRDIDQLSAAGVPVVAQRGRDGGFELLDGWKTTLTGLTPAESQAVFLSGLAGPAAQLGLGDAVGSAQLKLMAALPAAWRDDAQRVAARLHLDPVAWYREAEPAPHLAAVAAAVWNGQPLQLRYESWKATVQRLAHPLGLVLKAGTWYLVAAVDGGGPPRIFRVAGILAAEALPGRVQRPRRFDLARTWADAVARFERELYAGRATVLATPQGLQRLRRHSALLARAVATATQRPTRRADGRMRLVIPVEGLQQSAGLLMQWAPEVEVLQPAALRRAVVQRLQQGLDHYRNVGPPPGRTLR
jgi:predicted DNA-binding transcriptional regulator YafY